MPLCYEFCKHYCVHVTSLPCANEVCVGLRLHYGSHTLFRVWTNADLMVNLLRCGFYEPLNMVKHDCKFTAWCEMKCCVGCIAQCEMQTVTLLWERGIAFELVTLFTQAIWYVTTSKYTRNFHCTCELYDYCPVGANNVVLSAGAEQEVLRVSHTETYRLPTRLDWIHAYADKELTLITSLNVL